MVAAACGDDGVADLGSPTDQTAGANATPGATAAPAPAATQAPPPSTGIDRAAELLGRWDISDYALADGSFTNVVGAEPVFLEFGADGTLSYNTGCNSGTTEYATSGTYIVPTSALDDTPEGQPITIGPSFAQTEIGCEGFLGDQDRDLPANMAAAARFRLDDDRLQLLNEFFLIEATRVG